MHEIAFPVSQTGMRRNGNYWNENYMSLVFFQQKINTTASLQAPGFPSGNANCFVDLCEWIGKVEGCTFDKQHFLISLGVQEMSGSSVPGSGQAVSTQLDYLRSHKYIWLCWLPDAIKAAKALERWCLRDPRLHWSKMRLRLRRAALSSPPCTYKWRGGYNECQPNLCLLN